MNIVEGAMREIIIVGVDNTPERVYEYTPDYTKEYSVDSGGGAATYLAFLQETVMPLVEKSYRLASPVSWGIGGSSLGGLLSCFAGWTAAATYDQAMCMSSSFWWNYEVFDDSIMVREPPPSPQDITFYVDSGTGDGGSSGTDDEQETISVRTHLETLGWKLNQTLFYYLQQGGQHNEASWGARVHIPLADLYPPQAGQD